MRLTDEQKNETKNMSLMQLQIWFAKNETEFDLSASGFRNWVSKYYPEKLKTK